MTRSPNPKVVSIWAYRKRIEYEAADQFNRMAAGLAQLKADDKIVRLAQRSAKDEMRHAGLCQKVIDCRGSEVAFHPPQLGIPLGPGDLGLRERILYACVSLSCVTETLSTALLIEMQKQAEPLTVREIVRSILEDEIIHSRIGWAQLHSEASRGDVSWLSTYIPAMVREAMVGDAPPTTETSDDLSAWGILPSHKARSIMLKTVEEVILPGLKVYGVSAIVD